MAEDAGPESSPAAPGPEATPDAIDSTDPTERRLRRLATRSGTYRGPIVAVTRGWVSRDGKWHAFAARFLDFAVLTPEHLVLCSTGFFTRRPRHQVLREPLNRLVVIPLGPEPIRKLRIVGDFSRPLLLELSVSLENMAFVRTLLGSTHRGPRLPPLNGDQPGTTP